MEHNRTRTTSRPKTSKIATRVQAKLPRRNVDMWVSVQNVNILYILVLRLSMKNLRECVEQYINTTGCLNQIVHPLLVLLVRDVNGVSDTEILKTHNQESCTKEDHISLYKMDRIWFAFVNTNEPQENNPLLERLSGFLKENSELTIDFVTFLSWIIQESVTESNPDRNNTITFDDYNQKITIEISLPEITEIDRKKMDIQLHNKTIEFHFFIPEDISFVYTMPPLYNFSAPTDIWQCASIADGTFHFTLDLSSTNDDTVNNNNQSTSNPTHSITPLSIDGSIILLVNRDCTFPALHQLIVATCNTVSYNIYVIFESVFYLDRIIATLHLRDQFNIPLQYAVQYAARKRDYNVTLNIPADYMAVLDRFVPVTPLHFLIEVFQETNNVQTIAIQYLQPWITDLRLRCRFLPSEVAVAVLVRARIQCGIDPWTNVDSRVNLSAVKNCIQYMQGRSI